MDKKLRLSKKQMFIILPIVILAAFLTVLSVSVAKSMPVIDTTKLDTDKTTFIYNKDGNVIASLHGEKNRIPIPLNEISKNIVNAFVATEDARFYQHHGVDLKAITRAVYVNLNSKDTMEGGSTITQQLVKNSLLTPEKTLKRKIQEAYLAVKMERQYTKDEIMEMYLNRIYFGHGAYGIQAAAKVYFGKKASELTAGESAMLAGIPKNPSVYSPYRDISVAKERQAVVLDQMVKEKYINEQEAKNAKDETLHLVGLKADEDVKHIDFVDYVIDEVEKENGITAARVYRGGLKIYTTLDEKIQNNAEEVYAKDNLFPASKPDQMVQSGMALLDPHTGEIKALVGGRKQTVLRGRNRAVDPVGQPGSTFKPIVVYGPAIELKVSPNTVLIDQPINIHGYQPKNSDWAYRGPITMRQAIAGSVNIFAVKLLDKIGVDQGISFAKKLGFNQLGDYDRGLSLALGGTNKWVSPLQMATAFGAFDNNGQLINSHTISKITDFNGKELYVAKPSPQQVMSEQTAKIMTNLLEGVVNGGTGTRARMNRPVAGKTGTTELDGKAFRGIRGNRDTWFVGYTPELVAAVWVGYDKTDSQHYMNSYGGNYPAMIWKEVMTLALQGVPLKDFDRNYNYNGFSYRFNEAITKPPEPKVEPKLTPTPAPIPVPETKLKQPDTPTEPGKSGKPGSDNPTVPDNTDPNPGTGNTGHDTPIKNGKGTPDKPKTSP